jgi:hypothetical protein
MRIVKSLVLSAALLAVVPAAANAQDHRFHFNIGGGPTFVGGGIGNTFSTGWGPGLGLTFDVTSRLGVQFEYAYRYFSSENYVDFFLGTFAANHQTHQLDFNIVYNLTPADSKVRIYIVGGPGAYYRSVDITEYIGNGVICDPWLYLCGVYPVTGVVASRGGWDFGGNIGGGVGFKLGDSGSEFFIESRYHFIKGPEITVPANLPNPPPAGRNANGYYTPLTFGFRF